MSRFTRRNLLASIGGAVSVGLAGCGYQPGGGELDWEERGPRTDRIFGGRREVHWLARDERLVAVRNRNSRTFDFEEERWVDVEDALVTAYGPRGETQWNGNTDDQHDGEPAISSAGVFVPIEDGSVTALYTEEASAGARTETEAGTESDARTEAEARTVAGAIHWTNDRRGSTLDLEASDELVVGTHADGFVVFDAETGDGLGAREFDSIPIERRAALAVGSERVWIAGEGGESVLYCFDPDGSERVDFPLPSSPVSIESMGGTCIVALEDGLRSIDSDGEDRWTVDLGRLSDPPVVADDRIYAVSDDDLLAFDAASGDLLWERPSPFSARFVAGADGLRGFGRDGGACRLVGLTDAGEDWWAVPAPEQLDCSADHFLLGDRLVAVDDDRLYGFYAGPGRRRSIL